MESFIKFYFKMNSKSQKLFSILSELGFWQESIPNKDLYRPKTELVKLSYFLLTTSDFPTYRRYNRKISQPTRRASFPPRMAFDPVPTIDSKVIIDTTRPY